MTGPLADAAPTLEAYQQSLDQAASISMDPGKPLRLYLRSATSLFKQACIYRNETNLEAAYVLYLKFSRLMLQELPSHPEYRLEQHVESVSQLRQVKRISFPCDSIC